MYDGNQGVPFYIETNKKFYNKHFSNELRDYCQNQHELSYYDVDVSIPSEQLYNDCKNSKSSSIQIKPCLYASEDGYSYVDGQKEKISNYGECSGVGFTLSDDAITFFGYHSWFEW